MNFLSILYCEVIKIYRSKVFLLSFVIFSISLVILSLGIEQRNWEAFFDGFLALTANMAMLVNFFIASWVFGREFIDKTNKDLIAKPISRAIVVMSKFAVIFLWGILFIIFLFAVSLCIGFFIGFTDFSDALLLEALLKYIITSLLYVFISTVGALFASISKGILAPVGILFVIAMASNMLNNTIAAPYFPWTIPANLFADKISINFISIGIVFFTGIFGIIGTFIWWRFAEQE